MKHTFFFLLLLLLSSCAVQAQLVHAKRMFSETWYINGQKSDTREVRLHLDKANKEAHKHFRQAKSAETWMLAFNVVAIAGAGWVLGASAGGSDNTLGGWGMLVLGTSGAAISSAVRGSKYDRAVEVYNLSITPPTRK